MEAQTNWNEPRARARLELDDASAAEMTAARFRLLNGAAHLAELQPDADSFMLRGKVDSRTLTMRITVENNNTLPFLRETVGP